MFGASVPNNCRNKHDVINSAASAASARGGCASSRLDHGLEFYVIRGGRASSRLIPEFIHCFPSAVRPFGGGCAFWRWMSTDFEHFECLSSLLALHVAFWRWIWLFGGGCCFLTVDVAFRRWMLLFWRWMLLFGGGCCFLKLNVLFFARNSYVGCYLSPGLPLITKLGLASVQVGAKGTL